MKAEKYTNLTEEDILYIHSEDFISRFGDWEKSNRLEKLMEAEPIIGLEKIVFNRSDIGSTIEILKKNKDRKGLQTLEKEIGKTILGTYQNDDKGMSYADAVKETSAILFLSLQNISNAPATKKTNGRYAIYKNGIKTGIGTDKNGKFVVTGFNFNDTKQEAADAIKSVNALYGYAPEFLDIYAQVGAVYASLSNNITQQNSPVNEQNSKYKKILFDSAEINVNGTMPHCKNGLIKGFENAVSYLDNFCNENSKLRNENLELKKTALYYNWKM